MHRSDIQSINISYKSGTIPTSTRLTLIRDNEGFIFSLIPLPDSKENEPSTDGNVYNSALDIFQVTVNRIGKDNIIEIIVPEDDDLLTSEEIRSIVGDEINMTTHLK